MKNLPTAFQRTTLWTAITALSMTVIGAIAVGLVYLATTVLSFLQPILVPFAVAGVLAYLLEPGVKWLESRGLERSRSVLLVFVVFSLSIGGLAWWVTPKLWEQATNLTDKVPVYTVKARDAAAVEHTLATLRAGGVAIEDLANLLNCVKPPKKPKPKRSASSKKPS